MHSTRTPCKMGARSGRSGHAAAPGSPLDAGPPLHADQRGAIVVVAVFMSMFLVGCLWYVIGIGETALYRERLDAGADAVAFTGAVYHARGMNMIAMLNLIIAASLAIIVVAKALKFILAIVFNAAKVICVLAQKADPPEDDEGACAAWKEAGTKMQLLSTVIDKVEAAGDGLLAGLSSAQREIAIVTPWVAATESTTTAAKYAPMVVGGATVSLSMVPTAKRLGLPVFDEDYEITCQRGGDIAPEMITAMIPEGFIEYLNGADPLDLVWKFSPEYCGAASFSGKDMDLFDENDVCKKKKWKYNKDKKPEDPPFDWDKCTAESKVKDEDVKEVMDKEKVPNVDPVENLDPVDAPESKTAKRIADNAENGNDYFQVYAILAGNIERLHKPDKGVQIAAGKNAVTSVANELEGYGFAQAEFYYDQTADALKEDRCWKPSGAKSFKCGLKWPEYRENALWNLRWRARLRLFRTPTNVDVNVLVTGITNVPAPAGSYNPAVLGAINGAIGNKVPQKMLKAKSDITKAILNP